MEQTTVRDIVTRDFRTAAVFEKHSIDFCCHGSVGLEQACKERGVSPEQLRSELSALATPDNQGVRPFSDWDLDDLANYIVRTHHAYVRKAIPILLGHTQKVVTVHGERHPELTGIRACFQNVAEEMTRHMMKEEMMLFPYIKSLAASTRTGEPASVPPFETIKNPIRMMEAEHVLAGDGMETIRRFSSSYTIPSDACTTYRITYQELEAFEQDLHKHVHLENNILFPKAVELEEKLLVRN
jgi:regulator of cell morphogenesis and NO signaling